MDLYEPQWIVLRWPVGLLTEHQRELLVEYLDDNFQIGTVRFEAGDPNSAVEILGSAQSVVRSAVLGYIEKFVLAPPSEPPPVYDAEYDD
jgi:hypothetical protein